MRRRTTFLGAALCLLLCLAGCDSVEDRLVFPGTALQGRPTSVIPPRSDYELVPLATADGTRIQAVYGKALTSSGTAEQDSPRRPTVIFFYGNGACAAGMLEVFYRLRLQGANVIMADYPGYGMSGGTASEAGCYATADAEYDYVSSLPGTDKERIVSCGWSMGGAVAIDLAARRKVVSLATVSAFTSITAMAHTVAAWLPSTLILRSRFDNLSKMPGITCPILIAHGSADTIVPPSMADQLVAAAKSQVVQIRLQGAGHNDAFDAGGTLLWNGLHGIIFTDPR